MFSKKQICPRCGKENTEIITNGEKEKLKQIKIKLALCLFFTITPLLPFIVNLARKSYTFADWSCWIAIVMIAIPLAFSIFYFVKWFKARKYSPVEFFYCQNCGYFYPITPPIEHEENQQD